VATTITFPDNLTPRAERTLRQASEEAKRMGAEGFIGVEHIFLPSSPTSTPFQHRSWTSSELQATLAAK
jgi:hypothetical protein